MQYLTAAGFRKVIPSFRPSYNLADFLAPIGAGTGCVESFETALCRYFDCRHALLFPYGRTAIHATLKALFPGGGEVVQPAYNCVVVAHATRLAGLTPVFVDTLPGSPNQDPEQMVGRIGRDSVAAIPTSIFGHTYDALSLTRAIKKRNPGIRVFHDCCQAFDVSWENTRIALAGDGAFLAFGIGKPMTSIYGGALLTNDDDIASAVRRFRDDNFRRRGRLAAAGRFLYFLASWFGLSGPGVIVSDFLIARDTPLRRYLQRLRARERIRLPDDNDTFMLPTEAAVGLSQLQRASSLMQRRKTIAESYDRLLAEAKGVEAISWPRGSTCTIYSFRMARAEDRKILIGKLRQGGIQAGTILDYVVPELECHRPPSAPPPGTLYPNAVQWKRRVVNLPNHPSLTSRQVERIMSRVHGALKEMYG